MIALVAAVALTTAGEAGARVSVYSDDDKTQVVSPYVYATAPVSGGSLTAAYTADVISSASVDIRTAASPTTIHDVRNQMSAGYSRQSGDLTLGASYIYSQEHDYLSNGGTISIAQDLLEKNVTLALSGGYQHNLAWRTGDAAGAKPLDVVSLGGVYTQTLSADALAMLSYDFMYGNGFQASPYRFVPIDVPGDPGHPSVPENEPALRLRHAVTARLAQSLGPIGAIQADYRYYSDTWGLVAHTLRAQLMLEPGDAWAVRIATRAYTQGDASFYQPHYTAPVTYMSGDREMSSMWSVLGGVKVAYSYPDRANKHVTFDVKGDVVHFSYRDFPYLQSRLATVVEAGVTLKW